MIEVIDQVADAVTRSAPLLALVRLAQLKQLITGEDGPFEMGRT